MGANASCRPCFSMFITRRLFLSQPQVSFSVFERSIEALAANHSVDLNGYQSQTAL
jgi:hypothetical protein